MPIFNKKGKWFIDYYFEGRRVRESVGKNKKLAQQALAIRKAEILQGKYKLKKKSELGFKDFINQHYLDHIKNYKRSYDRDLVHIRYLSLYLKNTYLSKITPLEIEKYRSLRLREVSPSTVNREISCLRHIFNMAIKWGKLEHNPTKKIKFFKEPDPTENMRILAREEEKRLIEASTITLRPIIITALNTGMRKAEVLNLTWDRVDFEQRMIFITNTKSGKSRTIPMNDYLTNTLKCVKTISHRVFCNKKGKPLATINRCFYEAVKKAGIGRLRFHDLRHTFASRLIMKGVDLVTVKELLGHSSINMTMRYAHPTSDHKKWAIEVLNLDTNGHHMDTKLKVKIPQFA